MNSGNISGNKNSGNMNSGNISGNTGMYVRVSFSDQ
jgi:hypothetical protein